MEAFIQWIWWESQTEARKIRKWQVFIDWTTLSLRMSMIVYMITLNYMEKLVTTVPDSSLYSKGYKGRAKLDNCK